MTTAIAPRSNQTAIYPSVELVKRIFPSAPVSNVATNLPYVLRAMAKKELTSTGQLIGILATIAVEVPVFAPIEEYGKGGGRHSIWYGRGFVQLTWRRNYLLYKRYSGLDVVAKPELLLVPEVAADALVWYWCGGSGAPDIRPYAEKADWANVRSIINAGSPGKIGICWGVDVFYQAVESAIANLTQGLDKEALGNIPGNYGLGCVDGGDGARRNYTGLNNPNSMGDAIATALNLQAAFNWRSHEFESTINVADFPEILALKTQRKFKLKNFGDDLDDEYKAESILLTCGRHMEMELTGYKKDPLASEPLVFKHDTNSPLIDATTVASSSGDIPGRMLAAAKANFGKSTADGPEGGNLACAFAMGKFVVMPAGLQKLGAGTYGSNAVKEVVREIKQGRGVQIPREQAIPGDIWTDSFDNRHIGIVWEGTNAGATKILSNSSSKAAFSWVGTVEGMGRYYGGGSNFYRVTS